MSITPWQTRWDTLGIPKDTAIQGEIDELRAALQERDAEIERLTGSELGLNRYLAIVEADLSSTRKQIGAQRKVLEQALEALKAQPIETRVVWKDGIDLDVPVAHSKLCKAAITAIQEVLHANKPE